jgi:rod shape-determining protein MreD
MIYCLHIGMSIGLLIVQTTLLPLLPLSGQFYDLLIPFVIYLTLFRPAHESLPFVFFLGLLVDNLSGAPFGLYITSYFWLYAGVKMVASYLRLANRMLLALIVCGGVLVQNGLMLVAASLTAGSWKPMTQFIGIVTGQLIWALVTGPLIITLYRFGLTHLGRIAGKPFEGSNGEVAESS